MVDLHLHIGCGNLGKLRELLEAGYDPNFRYRGYSCLSLAINIGKVELVQELLNYNVDVNALSEDRVGHLEPPLVTACRLRDVRLVKLLLKTSIETGLDMRATDFYGHCALWVTAKMGQLDILDILLDYGATFEHINTWDRCPLYVATHSGHRRRHALSKRLMMTGCDLNLRDRRGRGPVFWATVNKEPTLLSLLILCGAQLTLQDKAFVMATLNVECHNAEWLKWKFWLEYHCANPLSLKCLCRIVIRKCILRQNTLCKLESKLLQLKLPERVNIFLMFDD